MQLALVWGGVSLWRSLMRLDSIDEFRLDLHPYVGGEGTLFNDDVPQSYRLDLVSSTAFSNGIAPAKLTFRKPTDKRTHLP
jgi:dihydrofolate reductase